MGRFADRRGREPQFHHVALLPLHVLSAPACYRAGDGQPGLPADQDRA